MANQKLMKGLLIGTGLFLAYKMLTKDKQAVSPNAGKGGGDIVKKTSGPQSNPVVNTGILPGEPQVNMNTGTNTSTIPNTGGVMIPQSFNPTKNNPTPGVVVTPSGQIMPMPQQMPTQPGMRPMNTGPANFPMIHGF